MLLTLFITFQNKQNATKKNKKTDINFSITRNRRKTKRRMMTAPSLLLVVRNETL